MSESDDRLLDLVELWEERRRQGRTVSPAELCRDCPELRPELEKHLAWQAALEKLRSAAVPSKETQSESLATPSFGQAPVSPGGRDEPPPSVPGYEILGRLGEGGMGTVWKARHVNLPGRPVALKFVRAEYLTAAMLARLLAEAQAVSLLDHPHIVKVYEVGQCPPGKSGGNAAVPYIALEFVPGGSLAGRLSEPLAPDVTARLVAVLARAVQHAHERGIIHRDLKPDNVLLAPPSDVTALNTPFGCPKVADFGLAREVQSEQRLSQSGTVAGTPAYMAPEQARGRKDVGPPADVYALGGILYRLLAGRVPFAADSHVDLLYKVCTEPPPPLREVRPEVPEALERICLACLEKEPARRPTAGELAGRLERFLGGLEETEVYASAPGGRKSSRRRRGLLAACVVAALLLGAAGGLLWWWRFGQPSTPAAGANPIISPDPPQDAPLTIKPIRATLYEIVGEEADAVGQLGDRAPLAHVGDAATLVVEFSEPAYFYVIGFNFDGKEELAWPLNAEGKADRAKKPERLPRLRLPAGDDKLILDDSTRGGVQAYAVAASRQPLPAYDEWRKGRKDVTWRVYPPGGTVWQADAIGSYAVLGGVALDRGERGTAGKVGGGPPLAALCRALLGDGVEAVEAIAFPVLAKEAGR